MSRQTMSNEPPTTREQSEWAKETDHPVWPEEHDDTELLRIIAHNLACLVDSVDTLRQLLERGGGRGP